jgi:hyaluronoglucosaminidase
LESKKRNWLAIRSFEVNPVEASDFGWDGNPFTSVKIAGALSFEMPEGGKTAYMMLGKLPKEGVVCRLLDKSGEEIGKHKVKSSLHAVELTDKVHAIELRGAVELIECFIYTTDEALPALK